MKPPGTVRWPIAVALLKSMRRAALKDRAVRVFVANAVGRWAGASREEINEGLANLDAEAADIKRRNRHG